MTLHRGTRLMSCVLLAVLAGVAACARREPPPKEYTLTGQILAVKPESQEVLVKHDDIKGFMPAMTMPYKVEDPSLLNGATPGDLISATLVVGETRAFLSSIEKTGHAEVEMPATTPEVSIFDLLQPGDQVPDAALIDEDGQPRPISSYLGHAVALTFIYTRCPDPEFCPLMSKQFAAVEQVIARTPELSGARLLSVSFDPEHDTPAVLKAYSAAEKANPQIWRFATGPADVIGAFSSRFGVTVTRNDSPVLVHNLGTAVIDTRGRLVALHSTNQWKPADLVAELKTAAASGD